MESSSIRPPRLAVVGGAGHDPSAIDERDQEREVLAEVARALRGAVTKLPDDSDWAEVLSRWAAMLDRVLRRPRRPPGL